MNEYTHLEIVTKVCDLIDSLDQDEFDSYEVAILVYKHIDIPNKVGRLALDLRE